MKNTVDEKFGAAITVSVPTSDSESGKQNVAGPPILESASACLTVEGSNSAKSEDAQLHADFSSNNYHLLEKLGSGGMGTVYKARRSGVDKTLAVKKLNAKLSADESSVKRFEQEAKSASFLTHPNLVSVYDFGRDSRGEPYIVMDFVDGESLAEVLRREKQLEVLRFIRIMVQVCDALEHAHTKQIIHRDLKPNNILLVPNEDGSDFVKLVDFGIARVLPQAASENQRLTQTGDVVGSPVYMSPEQCVGDDLDGRSDIYALGCVMYECLVGRPPFLGDNVVQTILNHLKGNPPAFDKAGRSGLTNGLESLVLKCLAKSPTERFQSMKELRDALEVFDDSTSPARKQLIRRIHWNQAARKNLARCDRMFPLAVMLLAAILMPTCWHFWYESADAELQSALQAAEVAAGHGELAVAELSWSKAAGIANQMFKSPVEQATIRLKLANMHSAIGECDRAIPIYQRCLQLLGNSREGLPLKIELLPNLISDMNRSSQLQVAQEHDALRKRGVAQNKAGNFVAAIPLLNPASQDRENNSSLDLAQAYEALAEPCGAEDKLSFLHYARYYASTVPLRQPKVVANLEAKIDATIRAMDMDPSSLVVRQQLLTEEFNGGDVVGYSQEAEIYERILDHAGQKELLELQVTQHLVNPYKQVEKPKPREAQVARHMADAYLKPAIALPPNTRPLIDNLLASAERTGLSNARFSAYWLEQLSLLSLNGERMSDAEKYARKALAVREEKDLDNAESNAIQFQKYRAEVNLLQAVAAQNRFSEVAMIADTAIPHTRQCRDLSPERYVKEYIDAVIAYHKIGQHQIARELMNELYLNIKDETDGAYPYAGRSDGPIPSPDATRIRK